MKKWTWLTTILFLGVFLFSGVAAAAESGDIVGDPLSGPGSVNITTKGNLMMSFGTLTRIIPTSETNWDFGLEDDLDGRQLLGGALSGGFFKQHANESGFVAENYIRAESKLYFNVLPKDRKWSFHSALEFDRPIDVDVVDNRGGETDTSNFGLERLRATYSLTDNLRLNAGWDLWFIPDPAMLTFGDDDPGVWLDGQYDKFDFSVAYIKQEENNWGTDFNYSTDDNDDRNLYAGYLTYHLTEGHDLTVVGMYDRIRDVPVGSILERLSGSAGAVPDTDTYYLGAVYKGEEGKISYFLEGIYQFGSADNTGLAEDDYDVSSYALAGDVEFKLDDMVGFGLKPHIGFQYTSGDDDPNDDELGGYTGVVTGQRYTKFGGEMTIIGDGNTLLGTLIYSYLPTLYGNGTPVVVGGLTNGTGFGSSRGDNPGLTMTSFGLTASPKRFLIFKTNVNSFWWNEDIAVPSFVNPAVVTEVDGGYTGTEFDAELTLATSKYSFIKLQGAVFFPGEAIEDVSSARTSLLAPGDGPESDDEAYRLGMEFILKF